MSPHPVLKGRPQTLTPLGPKFRNRWVWRDHLARLRPRPGRWVGWGLSLRLSPTPWGVAPQRLQVHLRDAPPDGAEAGPAEVWACLLLARPQAARAWRPVRPTSGSERADVTSAHVTNLWPEPVTRPSDIYDGGQTPPLWVPLPGHMARGVAWGLGWDTGPVPQASGCFGAQRRGHQGECGWSRRTSWGRWDAPTSTYQDGSPSSLLC